MALTGTVRQDAEGLASPRAVSTKPVDFDINAQRFEFRAIRPGLGDIDVGSLIESLEWRDESGEDNINAMPVLRGTLTLRKPAPDQLGAGIEIEDGHRIRCNLRYGEELVRLWEMRIYTPRLDAAEGGWTFEMADDLVLVSGSNDNFKYQRGKKHRKNGWRYDEVVRDICRRYRIPLGPVVKGKHRIKNFNETSTSPLSAIRMLVEEERKFTGRPYVIRWEWLSGKKKYGLTIKPLRRNPTLYTLKDQLVSANIETNRTAELATAITARGQGKNGKKRKKYVVRVVSREGVQRYGYIHKQERIKGDIDSLGELRERAERLLARRLKPLRTIEVSHPGIAFVRRGDAVRVSLPEEGFSGARGLLFVAGVVHSMSAGDYSMSLVLNYTDPADPQKLREERDKALRARKRRSG